MALMSTGVHQSQQIYAVSHAVRLVRKLYSTTSNAPKGKTPSSSRWLKRQQSDPFVKQAKAERFRARSAYKLMAIDDKHHFLKQGSIVVDCGASPGSWSQVAALRTHSNKLKEEELKRMARGAVIAVDIKRMEPLPGVVLLDNNNVTLPETWQKVLEVLRGHQADVVMSDMAPNASGIHQLDHARVLDLCESALAFSHALLKEGGVFVCKLWQGGELKDFKSKLKNSFDKVDEHIPQATRKESAEVYFVAKGYRQQTT